MTRNGKIAGNIMRPPDEDCHPTSSPGMAQKGELTAARARLGRFSRINNFAHLVLAARTSEKVPLTAEALRLNASKPHSSAAHGTNVVHLEPWRNGRGAAAYRNGRIDDFSRDASWRQWQLKVLRHRWN